ncbi:hypothetical protein M422DRAFT_782174 [Sphaerobolus stellatus SS14]|uniref:Uncharacterized protein n=1 Tax=Sphaerobolus stellatus (strain SS14) TaxID=990650 RepID=A0A0C9VGC2_SPHS4|nr:hypothetical protein M422DRAFT_782174 [Sphaerobolus stellatus SS14]
MALAKLKEAIGKEGFFLELDLADLKSVKQAAEEFLVTWEKLGEFTSYTCQWCHDSPLDQFTVQGYDLQFGTNTLGRYYFTMLLLPALQRTTGTNMTGKKARVINGSSIGHIDAPIEIPWNVLKAGSEDSKLKG